MSVDPVSLGIQFALMAAQMALGASRKIEGPRSEIAFTSGDYGTPLNRVWGTSWITPAYIWGEDLTETVKQSKTKGGKFNNYTYSGNFAVALACHEIAAVLRVKLDGHLALDYTGAGPVTPFDLGEVSSGKGGSGVGAITDYIAIYLGTEVQEPDPHMAAIIDARFGADSTPAYRGTAYIVFKDLPLEKFGNRVPQVEVEIAGLVAPHYPYKRLIDAPSGQARMLLGLGASVLVTAGTGFIDGDPVPLTLFDQAAGALMLDAEPALTVYAVGADGTLWGASAFTAGTATTITGLSPDGGGISVPASGAVGMTIGDLWAFGTGSAARIYGRSVLGTHYLASYLPGGAVTLIDVQAVTGAVDAWHPFSCFEDADGERWVAGGLVGSATLYLYNLTNPRTLTVTMASALSALAEDVPARHFQDAANDHFVVGWNNTVVSVGRTSGTVLGSAAHSTSAARCPFRHARASDASWFMLSTSSQIKEYAATDLSVIRTIALGSWGISVNQTIGIYDPIGHAWAAITDGDLVWFYLDRVTGSATTLQQVVEEVAALGGADLATIVAGALTQAVAGYAVTGGTGKDWVEPLLDIHDVDPRPHGYDLEFLPRGAAAGGTLPSTRFAAPGVNPGESAPLWTRPSSGGSDIPSLVMLQFADRGAEQQPNAVPSGPLGEVDGSRTLTIDLKTLALHVDDAQALVARYHRRKCFDAVEVEHAVSRREIALEPGDVKVLDLDGELLTARLSGMVMDADGAVQLQWKRDDPSVAQLANRTGASFDGRTAAAIAAPLISKGFVLDVALLADSEDNPLPLLHLAAAPYAAGAWPGATVFEASGGEYTVEIGSVGAGLQASWGYALGVLAAPVSPWLWDRGSQVDVLLQVGAVAGCTEADIDADPTRNLALIGDELVNFTVAVLQGDGSYRLSGFKRGRRGSEWACAGHAARDVFVLLDRTVLASKGLDTVGTDRSYKVVTSGRSTSGAFPIDLAPFTGASLKPYAPAQLKATISGSDWVLTWVRRTRVGGAWTSGTGIPLSEVSELYTVEIMDGATVKRTITGLTSATTTYTSAQQTTDWGAPLGTTPAFRVYQISDAVGRGFAAAA